MAPGREVMNYFVSWLEKGGVYPCILMNSGRGLLLCE
jgi:hypothetical protein